jgi:hypothetical protein
MQATRKPRRTQQRAAKLQTVGAALVLWLTTDRLTVAYRLTKLPSDFGHAYRLDKADQGDGQPETYDVLLDGERSSCECKGFLRWHHCKHVESLTTLRQLGRV